MNFCCCTRFIRSLQYRLGWSFFLPVAQFEINEGGVCGCVRACVILIVVVYDPFVVRHFDILVNESRMLCFFW